MIHKKNVPIMPKSVATWLVENTSLTFQQIADFCDLHILDVNAIADGNMVVNPINPIETGELTLKDLEEAQNNPDIAVNFNYNEELDQYLNDLHSKKASKNKSRNDKANAIFWIIDQYPELTNYKIAKLVSATSTLVASIRDKSHWNYGNLVHKNPIVLGLCTEKDLQAAVKKIR